MESRFWNMPWHGWYKHKHWLSGRDQLRFPRRRIAPQTRAVMRRSALTSLNLLLKIKYPFIISSCKTYTTNNEFFIVSRNVIAFPHLLWHDWGTKSFMSPQIIYVVTRWRHQIAIGSWDRPSVVSTDLVIKCDYRPIPISGWSIGAFLTCTYNMVRVMVWLNVTRM